MSAGVVPGSSPRATRESVVTLHEDSENMERKLSKPKNNVVPVNKDHEKKERKFQREKFHLRTRYKTMVITTLWRTA